MPRPRHLTPRYRLARRRDTGSWEVRWTEDGRPRRVSCRTGDRDAAETFLRQFLAGLDAPPPAEQQTISMILDAYAAARAAHVVNPGELRMLNEHLRPHFGAVQPRHVNPALVRAFIAGRRRTVKDSTIGRECRHLRAALNWAVREGWIERAPYVEAPPLGVRRERVLAPAEARALLDACVAPHVRLFVLIGLNTGQRMTAICRLTWDRVDLAGRKIDFNEPDRRVTRKRRAIVPVNDQLHAALCEAQALAQTPFVIEYGGAPVKRMKHAFNRAVSAAGLADVTPHTLRHTAASRMAMKGVPVWRAAQILGMSVKTLEEVYAKYDPSYGLEDVRALEV